MAADDDMPAPEGILPLKTRLKFSTFLPLFFISATIPNT